MKTFVLAVMLLFLALPSQAEVLLILAPDAFLEELAVLERFKNCSARKTYLVGLSTVTNNPAYGAARDDPERIKRFIADAQKQENVTTVMLIGDCDTFPVRYVRALNTAWGTKYYPSDLYYADLYDSSGNFEDWDGDGDDHLGETDFNGGTNVNLVNLDGIDMHPDVEVARVPASNETEVERYVKKIIGYETTAPETWYDDAYLVVGDWGGESKMNGVVPELSSFDSLTTYSIYSMYTPPYDNATQNSERAAIINNSFANGSGLMLYHGHGSRNGWDNWYSVSDMSALINSSFDLPMLFATACYTGRFHFNREYYRVVNGTTWDQRNQTGPFSRPEPDPIQPSFVDATEGESMAEHFLVKRDTGGIGYIGCVSVAEHGVWIDPNDGLCLYFCQEYDRGTRRLGELWKSSMDEFVDYVSVNGMHYYAYIHIHKMFCFGDPSLILGGAFSKHLHGQISDIWTGSFWWPLFFKHSRYKLVGDVTVKIGTPLTASPGASLLFAPNVKIKAQDPNQSNGFQVNGTQSEPVFLLGSMEAPFSTKSIRGFKVSGAMRLRNGGEIKMY